MSVPLRAWLQSLPAGTEARLRAGGRYRAESPIRLDAKRALTINGRGASLVRTVAGDPADPKTRTRSSIDLQGGADIVIKGLNITGAHDQKGPHYRADFEAQHGVNVAGVQGVVICDTRIVNVLGDFVYFGFSGTAPDNNRTPTRNAHVYRNFFEYSGRQGIGMATGTNIVVEHNIIRDAGRSALDVEPLSDALEVHNVMLRNNVITDAKRFVSSLGARSVVVDGLAAIDNTLVGTAMSISVVGRTGPGPASKRNVVIVGNTSDRDCGCPRLIWLRGVDTAWVVANRAKVGARKGPYLQPADITGLVAAGNVWVP